MALRASRDASNAEDPMAAGGNEETINAARPKDSIYRIADGQDCLASRCSFLSKGGAESSVQPTPNLQGPCSKDDTQEEARSAE